jgi:hypothetical protein
LLLSIPSLPAPTALVPPMPLRTVTAPLPGSAALPPTPAILALALPIPIPTPLPSPTMPMPPSVALATPVSPTPPIPVLVLSTPMPLPALAPLISISVALATPAPLAPVDPALYPGFAHSRRVRARDSCSVRAHARVRVTKRPGSPLTWRRAPRPRSPGSVMRYVGRGSPGGHQPRSRAIPPIVDAPGRIP